MESTIMGIPVALGDDVSMHTKKVEGGRGRKTCPKCGIITGVRKKICDCNYRFKINKMGPGKKYEELDWTIVESGTTIYVQSNDVWISPEGEELPMGESREFVVKSVESNGLLLYSPKIGHLFQNMVNEGYNERTGITRRRAQIFKKKQRKKPQA